MNLSIRIPAPETTCKGCICETMNTLNLVADFDGRDKLKYEGICKKCGLGIITYFTGIQFDLVGIKEEDK